MKRRARNIALKVAYDGTMYHGFQRQTPPVIAVQNVLEEALESVFGDSIELAAAGRTDAGVHAAGQVVNFFSDGRIPLSRVLRAVNSLLPDDIVVKEVWEADRDFSARHSAKSKTYLYRIQQGETPNPFTSRFAWYERRPLDLEAMQAAMQILLGPHDFSSFRAAGGAPMSPIRTMLESDVYAIGGQIEFRLHGTGFLYHMVRNIVGTVHDVGLGRRSVQDFAAILAAKDRQKASPTAPARGLCLYEVVY